MTAVVGFGAFTASALRLGLGRDCREIFVMLGAGYRKQSGLIIRGLSSSSKSIVRGTKCRKEILRGVDALSATVGATLGPRGRNVLIEQTYGPPKITKDGVTVAKAINLANPLQNLGANLIKGVAQTANDNSGDGTTTATILAREIFRGGCEAVGAGLGPMEIIQGIKLAAKKVCEFLESNARPVKSSEDIYHIAKVSSNGDETVGSLIAEAIQKVGYDGTITINEGKKMNHELNIVEGYQFDRGFIAPYFITNSRSGKCEFDNALVLVVEDKISSVGSVLSILEQCHQKNIPLLMIAEDLDAEVLATLALNKLRSSLSVCAVKAPGFGDHKRKLLEDIAMVTGTKVFSTKEASGNRLGEKTMLNQLGQVKRCVVSKDQTLLLEGNSNIKEIEDRVGNIKSQLKNDSNVTDYEKNKLQERMAKLLGGVAVIHVGGASEIEVAEAKDRFEDALCATKAALESGILPGGGTALLFAAESLSSIMTADNIGVNAGINIIKKACSQPCKIIADNAGFEGPIVAGNLLRDHRFGQGFDACSGVYTNMFDSGKKQSVFFKFPRYPRPRQSRYDCNH